MKKLLFITMFLSLLVADANALPLTFDADFSAWSFVAGPAGALPGPASHNILNADNSDSLKWNLIGNTGGVHSDQYVYTHTGVIPSIEFDYRFKNDGNNDRLDLRVLDGADNVLWNNNPSLTPHSPGSDAPGAVAVMKHVVLALNSATVKFEYIHYGGTIKGKPAFFGAHPDTVDNWDAEVDNVILTPEPATLALLGIGALLTRKKKLH